MNWNKTLLVLAMGALTLSIGFAQPGPRGARRAGTYEAQTIPANEREKSVLAVLDEIDRTQRQGSMSVPVQDGRILRLLAESMGAKHVVELGTSIGYSGIWICLGLEKTGGKLTTFDIDEGRAAKARENFKKAGVTDRVTLIMGDAHEQVSKVKDQIDMVFLDADKDGYLDYMNKLLPLVRPGGLIVAHNINERQADPAFIKAISSNPALETIFLNQDVSGISVSMKKR